MTPSTHSAPASLPPSLDLRRHHNRRARVRLTLLLDGGIREIDAVIDTGFTGYLALPQSLIDEMSLAYLHPMRAVLADGTRSTFRVYAGTLRWHDMERDIDISATGNEPLLGMSLLEKNDLLMHVAEDGAVFIKPF